MRSGQGSCCIFTKIKLKNRVIGQTCVEIRKYLDVGVPLVTSLDGSLLVRLPSSLSPFRYYIIAFKIQHVNHPFKNYPICKILQTKHMPDSSVFFGL